MSSSSRRRVVLLGATGSIGRQACDVIARYPGRFELVGAVAGQNVDALAAVVERFGVPNSAVVSPRPGAVGDLPPGCGVGLEAAELVAGCGADVVCVGITGAAALAPTLAAIRTGADIALATKEVLVMAGELVRRLADEHGARLIPVDSEHSAIWQCLRGEVAASVSRLVLTASGGPFRELPLDEFGSVTPERALRHPTWLMGPKITIDSATMMNKGLEMIEAHFLFDVPYNRIEVAVHPSSVVHSYVEFCDGATIAQLGIPDMRTPIALALSGGERLDGVSPPVELRGGTPLEFFPVDPVRFPAVELARRSGIEGGAVPTAFNAANEVAVADFLQGAVSFVSITAVVDAVCREARGRSAATLADLIAADRWARGRAAQLIHATKSLRQ